LVPFAREAGTLARFPSVKARKLLRILQREPLNYRVTRQAGSHRRLVAPNHPPITWGFHDRRTLSPGEVRDILVKDVGLDEETALHLL